MFIKRSTIKKSKASLAVKKVDCPHCGAKKVSIFIDKKCPKCGKVIV